MPDVMKKLRDILSCDTVLGKVSKDEILVQQSC